MLCMLLARYERICSIEFDSTVQRGYALCASWLCVTPGRPGKLSGYHHFQFSTSNALVASLLCSHNQTKQEFGHIIDGPS